MSTESLKSLFSFTINSVSREAVFDLAYPSYKFKCKADKMPYETGWLAWRGSTVFSPPQTMTLLQAAVLAPVPARQLLLEDLQFIFQYLEDIETTLVFHLLPFSSRGRKYNLSLICSLTVTERSKCCDERIFTSAGCCFVPLKKTDNDSCPICPTTGENNSNSQHPVWIQGNKGYRSIVK